MSPTPSRWSTWMLSLTLVAATVLAVALGVRGQGTVRAEIQCFQGSFPVEVVDGEGQAQRRTLELPGLFHEQGIHDYAKVTYAIPVVVPETAVAADQGPYGVLLERARYAGQIEWDGERIARWGEYSDGGVRSGYDGSILAWIPPERNAPGRHEVRVTVVGDWDDGGALGRWIAGPFDALAQLRNWKEIERVALGIIGFSAGFSQLIIGIQRRSRRDRVWFGVLLIAFGFYLLTQSDTWFAWFPADALDIGVRLRLRRASLMAIAIAASGVVAHVLYDKVTGVPRVIAWIAGANGLVAALGPSLRWNAYANRVGDALLLFVGVWSAAATWRSAREGGNVTRLFLFAVTIGVVAALLDILVSKGVIPVSSLMLPSMLALWSAIWATLSLRDADARDRFQALVTQAVDGIVRVHSTTHILDANDAATALLGGSAVGRTLISYIDPEYIGTVRGHLDRARSRPDRIEFVLGTTQRRVESAASPLEDGSIIAMFRDVTEQRTIQGGLLRAARMESVGQLAGGLAHDFNNVLGILLAQLSLARQESARAPDVDHRLGQMETTVQRAIGLCRRLMTLARGGSAARHRIHPSVLIEQALELLRPAVEPAVRLRVLVGSGLPEITVVVAEIEEVLVNLVVNARDASPPGADVVLRAEREGSGVALIVEDAGPGIAASLREKVFEPFYTTKVTGKGTGLGLPVVARVVRDHEGSVRIEERDGGGARFVVWLPAHATSEIPAVAAVPATGGLRVLIVDDEPVLLDSVAEMLANTGCVVCKAHSAERVLAMEESVPAPDILVTDVLLGGMNGLDLAERAEARWPGVRILLMSGFLPDLQHWPQVRAGRWPVLDKPFRADDLHRALRALGADLRNPAPTGAPEEVA